MDLLKLYIEFQNSSYKNQCKIEKAQPNSVLKTLTISKIKQFDFNSHIISIYGAYEHFVEQLFALYLNSICSVITSYNLLPKDIQNNNLDKTILIIKQLDYRKNQNIKPEKLIEILHKNLNENSSVINVDAFKNHNANFRIKTIDKYFSEIGIKNLSSLIRQYEPLKSYLTTNISDFSSKKNKVIFPVLEHICNLRNDIAHGVNNVQLLNKSILFEYIEFMEIFTTSLFEFIHDNYLSKKFEHNTNDIEVIKIFNKEILCFNTKGRKINRNSTILVKAENNFPQFFLANIINIQQEGIDIKETKPNQNINIGILVDQNIKDTMSFKLIT